MRFHRVRSLTILASVAIGMYLPGSPVSAAGVDLAWDHCAGEGTGHQNASFACDTNAGRHSMYGSFVLDSTFPNVIGAEIILDLAASAPALPPWWQLYEAGTCRPTSLGVAGIADPTDVVCVDWSAGAALGGLARYCTIVGPCVDHPLFANVARVKVAYAVAPDFATTLAPATEYFMFRLDVDHARTVGAGSCGGCSVPVCIVLNSINVVERGNVSHRFLSAPNAPGSNFVTWQGGGVPVPGTLVSCPAATPARRTGWGSVKSLYR